MNSTTNCKFTFYTVSVKLKFNKYKMADTKFDLESQTA